MEMTDTYDNIEQQSSMQILEAAEPPPTKKNKLLEIISDVINPSLNKTSSIEKAKLEVSRYDGDSETEQDPLEFWKTNSDRYPTLSTLARKYLSVPGTSVHLLKRGLVIRHHDEIHDTR